MSMRLTRGAARRIDTEDLQPVDLRAERFTAIAAEDDEGRAVIAEVLGGVQDADLLDDLARLRSEIRLHWVSAAKSFLKIGRALRRIEERLGRAGFERFVAEKRVLPFGRSSAIKMMSVARAVDEGRIESDQVPPYSVAYDLVTLPDSMLQLAAQQGLVRADVTREEISAFKLAVRERREEAVPARISTTALRRELAVLDRRKAALTAELRKIEERRTAVLALLAD